MKPKILSSLIFTVLLSTHLQVWAQEESKTVQVEIGLEHSINFAQLLGSNQTIEYANRTVEYDQVSSRLTIDLGMFAIIHVSDLISIQPEFVYSMMGGHYVERTTVLHDLGAVKGDESISFSTDYLKFNLPINLKIHDMLYFQTGGYVSTLLSAETYTPWWHFDSGVERTSISDMNNFDAGILAGFGISTGVVNLTFRYNYGLIDIFQSGDYEDLDLSNGLFQFVAHWKIYSDKRK
ncbi:MAG: PorT family protein [Reichenbachiella sp.]